MSNIFAKAHVLVFHPPRVNTRIAHCALRVKGDGAYPEFTVTQASGLLL